MYILINAQGRVRASSPTNCLVGAVEVEAPEGFIPGEQHDWKYENGALTYAPEAANEAPTAEERIAQLEEQNAFLTECLLEMSEIIYA